MPLKRIALFTIILLEIRVTLVGDLRSLHLLLVEAGRLRHLREEHRLGRLLRAGNGGEDARTRVLAAVPGTQQAAEAVLLAQVPQTARVNKKELQAPEVAYQGEPKFEPIEKSTVARAVNTDKDITKVGDLYYMCFQGVWFMAKAPTGPWEVTSSVPKQIYEIPTSSPANNVTYVTVVEDDSDDEWVTFATVAAYTGVMIAWGCAVWGTGWYYPPYMGWYGGYPGYYPHYPSYGYGASYNPWTGAYGRVAVAYGPYGGAGVTSRYNPRTGTYSSATIWLLVTDPVTVADAVETGQVSPLVQALAGVLYDAFKGILRYL